MSKTRKPRLNHVFISVMLILGFALTGLSILYSSSFLAILGVAFVFWGAILFYVTPSRHVPLSLLNVSASSSTGNIERILTELNLSQKGRYLPPKYLKNFESSLVFIPEKPGQPLPKPEEVTEEKLLSNSKDGLFLTPSGLPLSKLFEEKLGVSFTQTDLAYVEQKLPKILIEDLELVESAEIQIQNNTASVILTCSIFDTVCQETDTQPRTHTQMGCLLSSAIACALAKATGEAVIIQSETHNPETKTTTIEYDIAAS